MPDKDNLSGIYTKIRGTIMEEKLKDIKITLFTEYCMVCNNGTYFKVGLREGRILSQLLSGKSNELIAENENLTQDEFDYIISVFESNGIIGKKIKEKFNPLHIKIPLFDIDSQLGKLCNCIHKYRQLRVIIFCMLLAFLAVGLLSITLKFDEIFRFESLILPFWQYILVYLIHTLVIFCHELGHGITCKYFGGKVGKIGVAFILFNPAMYCDISAVREFKEKYKQVLSSSAGFIVNAIYVGVFSVLYYFYPCNFFKVLIILSATSILINAIPFIRLDGYWILSFLTGIQNLYSKSIAKLVNIKYIFQYKSWKDYFLLGYGMVNGILIIYCTVRFLVGIVDMITKIC